MDQRRVDFNGDHLTGAGQQRFGKRSAAGTDFDDQRRMFTAGSLGDAVEDRFAEKEMLTEAATH